MTGGHVSVKFEHRLYNFYGLSGEMFKGYSVKILCNIFVQYLCLQYLLFCKKIGGLRIISSKEEPSAHVSVNRSSTN